MDTVRFQKWNCTLQFGKYSNGRIGIQLYNADPIKEDGYTMEPGTVPIAKATVNIPEENIEQDEVIVKDFSENDGMLDALLNAKIVSQPIRFIRSGFIQCPVCKLIVNIGI